ncbi:MAG: DUF1302 family protein [Betaproteobacteria bacterium]
MQWIRPGAGWFLAACLAANAGIANGQSATHAGGTSSRLQWATPAPLLVDDNAAVHHAGDFMRVAAAAEPASRDALFGDAPPKNARDALFDADAPAARASPRLSGFIDGLAAYTYADPTHWSRAVARLQLTGQGEIGNGVKWKLSGRVDGDPVYLRSGFYPDAVKRDQRVDFFYRENYIDFSAGDWDFRLGAQQIVWGEVIGLFFADVVSARDMREFLLPGFDVIRIPQWAARAEYTAGNAHVELIFIPVPAFDRIGKAGSEFYPVPLPSPAPNDVLQIFRDPQRPSRSLANANFGLRANTLLAGWDLAAFYYRSSSTAPTFYRLPGESPAQPFIVQPRYDRLWQGGGTLGKDFGDFVLKGEAVYTHGQNFSVADLTAAQSVVGRQTLDYIVSAEWSLPGDSRVNVQGFQRYYFGGGAGTLAIPNDGVGASIFLSTKLGILEPQLLWIRNLKDGGGLIRPRLSWAAARNITMSVGADVFTGPSDSFFGRFNNRDRLYTEVRYDF